MMRVSTKRLAVFVLLAVFAFTLTGCWNPFAPDKGDPVPIPPASYRVRLAPEDVLHNLRTAYIWKNHVEYLDCLSEDFVFFPNELDVQDPELQIPPEWFKSDERNMHENMFGSNSNVESITLTLTIIEDAHFPGIPEDPMDDTWEYKVGVDLRVNLFGDLTYLATAPSRYNMRVDTDQQGPNGELLVEVHQWFDLGDQGRSAGHDPDVVEKISLGHFKSLFMQ